MSGRPPRTDRGFGVSATLIKKRFMREPVIKITITDGANDVTFSNHGSFTIRTDIAFPNPLIRKDT